MTLLSSPGPRRRQALLAMLAAAGTAATAGHANAQTRPALAFELITPAEASRELEIRAKDEAVGLTEVRPRSMPQAAASVAGKPVFAIRVVSPSSQATVKAPLRIELTFETPPGTRVVPSTFRVLYGVMKLDLTERLRRFATINERGVVVDQAVVPDGLHRLLLTIADEQGNVAEQELRLRVGVAS
jgi:hypothetical protein